MNLELGAIYLAGLLTFLTPCVLPLIPIYFSILLGGALPAGGDSTPRRFQLVLHTTLFIVGFLTVFIALGMGVSAIGKLLNANRELLTLVGGLLIFLFGLKMLGVLKISWLEREYRLDDRKLGLSAGALNSLAMGVVFSLGWTPCVGPILGAVLTYTASTSADPVRGAMMLGVYGLGFATPLFLASFAASSAVPLLRKFSKFLPKLEKFTGALIAGVGLYAMFSIVSVPTAPEPVEVAQNGGKAAAKTNLAAEIEAKIASKKPKMIEFYSSNCPICRKMIPIVAAFERDCSQKGGAFEVLKIDISQPHYRYLGKKYRIRGVPTFVYFNAEGKEVARLVGYQRIHSLRQAYALLVGEQCPGIGIVKLDENSSKENIVQKENKNTDNTPLFCSDAPAQPQIENSNSNAPLSSEGKSEKEPQEGVFCDPHKKSKKGGEGSSCQN